MAEETVFRKFVKLAMECQTRNTKAKYNKLISEPLSPVTIVFIAQLREEYNDFMTDCTALLKAEEIYRQTQLN
ncbi:hypothetical protein OU798_16015 [Prolixibacteraceae bacterium Z1-6]|uniref:Uncharacterized protein n=1 Tax=Draconibacterium aestuarii TaxID=2998507 RepID=A0A9X3J7T6_9BACT|nr:hypothetical protein [Prolixibacteraceae bacterium Z1-6]